MYYRNAQVVCIDSTVELLRVFLMTNAKQLLVEQYKQHTEQYLFCFSKLLGSGEKDPTSNDLVSSFHFLCYHFWFTSLKQRYKKKKKINRENVLLVHRYIFRYALIRNRYTTIFVTDLFLSFDLKKLSHIWQIIKYQLRDFVIFQLIPKNNNHALVTDNVTICSSSLLIAFFI